MQQPLAKIIQRRRFLSRLLTDNAPDPAWKGSCKKALWVAINTFRCIYSFFVNQTKCTTSGLVHFILLSFNALTFLGQLFTTLNPFFPCWEYFDTLNSLKKLNDNRIISSSALYINSNLTLVPSMSFELSLIFPIVVLHRIMASSLFLTWFTLTRWILVLCRTVTW